MALAGERVYGGCQSNRGIGSYCCWMRKWDSCRWPQWFGMNLLFLLLYTMSRSLSSNKCLRCSDWDWNWARCDTR